MGYDPYRNTKLKEVIEQLDLEEWLERYVTLKIAPGEERRVETCPKCGNSNYKLYVNVESKRWICHVCEWGRHIGDVVELMAVLSDRTKFDVMKELAFSASPAPANDFIDRLMETFYKSTPINREQDSTIEVVKVETPGAASFSGFTSSRVLNYAYERGLTQEELDRFNLRVSAKLNKFIGPFLVFPVVFAGTPVAWQGRRINSKRNPKYVSSDAIADWVWPLGDEQLSQVKQHAKVTLVEGVFDALGLWRINTPAVCTFGKKISNKQVNLLKHLGVKSVNLMWDADAAVTSAERIRLGARKLRGEIESTALRLKNLFDVHIVDLSDQPDFAGLGKIDPGEILRTPEIVPWVEDRLASAVAVNSPAFFEWRLS